MKTNYNTVAPFTDKPIGIGPLLVHSIFAEACKNSPKVPSPIMYAHFQHSPL